jgi:hypothetical protein
MVYPINSRDDYIDIMENKTKPGDKLTYVTDQGTIPLHQPGSPVINPSPILGHAAKHILRLNQKFLVFMAKYFPGSYIMLLILVNGFMH